MVCFLCEIKVRKWPGKKSKFILTETKSWQKRIELFNIKVGFYCGKSQRSHQIVNKKHFPVSSPPRRLGRINILTEYKAPCFYSCLWITRIRNKSKQIVINIFLIWLAYFCSKKNSPKKILPQKNGIRKIILLNEARKKVPGTQSNPEKKYILYRILESENSEKSKFSLDFFFLVSP